MNLTMKIIASAAIISMAVYTGCRHEPELKKIKDNTTDTTSNPKDTIKPSGHPCSPDTVYYEKDLQPLLNNFCAISGCHDNATAADGINLSNYNQTITTGRVKPFDPNGTKFYDEIMDGKMPPYGYPKLSTQQTDMIKKWINQGALDLKCDNCDTSDFTFAKTIEPLIKTNCYGCHSGSSPSGGVMLTSYVEIKTQALNGNLVNTTKRTTKPMPPSYALKACEVENIVKWVNAGAPQN